MSTQSAPTLASDALIAMTATSRQRIETFADGVLAVDELDESHGVFSIKNTQFDAEAKDTLLRFCRKTGCGANFLRGYGDCGLLLAFKHGCPNNSVPILWYDRNNWRPLFRRFGI